MAADFLMNRLANSKNPYQGEYKKVLCVCSAGLMRSPKAAWVLSQEPYNYNTRAAGLTQEFALVPVDKVLLHWCSEVVCMSGAQADEVQDLLDDMQEEKPIISLNIPDMYGYRDPELVELIKSAYDEATKGVTNAD